MNKHWNLQKILTEKFDIDKKIILLFQEVKNELSESYSEIDEVAASNQLKVLSAMQKNKLSDTHFGFSSGYGYNDDGRECLEKVYADVFNTQSALVRPQLISGTHALTVALSGNLRYRDELLSPCGLPYDTLQGVIGIRNTRNSLKSMGISYKQVDLKDGSFDFDGIAQAITERTKMVTIQRSKGYAWRRSFSVAEIGELIAFIKRINPNCICMVDNCYGEFVETIEPSDVGADLVVGSLIKNPGGGLAPVGGYIAGKALYVENAADRLSAPGLGFEVGPSLGLTRSLMQGLFLAPSVVAASLKGAVLSSKIFERLGFEALPHSSQKRSDIVTAVKLLSEERVLAFCKGIQAAAPVDSFVRPVGDAMPGYDCDVVMAAGAFVQGSSIELSADAPLREPYIVYFQGGLTEHHSTFGILNAVNFLYKEGLISI